MLKVIIELHPSDGSPHREIAHGWITNNGSGSPDEGNYDVVLKEVGKPGPAKRGRVIGFQRLSLGPWSLLRRALVRAGLP